jgi:hypothetical protein
MEEEQGNSTTIFLTGVKYSTVFYLILENRGSNILSFLLIVNVQLMI